MTTDKIAIDEAIKLNTKFVPYVELHISKSNAEAIQLGIEALERIRKIREVPYIDWLQSMSEIRRVLPGETEEEK